MKFSSITAAALCATAASAAPTWSTWDKDHKGKGDHKSPFEFTSTFSVVATPDQVVNGSNVPTGGLPVSSTTSDHEAMTNVNSGRNRLL